MILRFLRLLAAFVLCFIGLALPYRARLAYGQALAWAAHAPFLLFGRLARKILRELEAP